MTPVGDVIQWAKATYDAQPDPRSLLVILDAMWGMFEQVAATRPIFGEDPSLAQWEIDANRFYYRMDSYFRLRDAMAAGQITGQYTANVVAPVLYGQGYASPGRETWALVRTPDVATPWSLANQLEARAENMTIKDRVRDRIVGAKQIFVKALEDGARSLGREGAEGAADVMTERTQILVRDLGPELQRRGTAAGSDLLMKAAFAAAALLILQRVLK